MTTVTFIKVNIKLRQAYTFRGLIHYIQWQEQRQHADRHGAGEGVERSTT